MELGELLTISQPLHLMPPPRATGAAPQKCELVPSLLFLLTLKPESPNYGPQAHLSLAWFCTAPKLRMVFTLLEDCNNKTEKLKISGRLGDGHKPN